MVMGERPLCCAVCGGVSRRVVWRENGYEGRACRCGTVYTAPPPRDAIDPTIDSHPDSYYAAAARRRVRWIKRYRTSGRLLEIGCGEGHFLSAAQAAGYDVAGIEPEPGRAGRAAERLGVHVECARLESCRLGRARFDIVYHCDLLSHFADPVGALQKMQGLLAPHGVLAFEVGLLADILIEVYAIESVCLRTEKMIESRGADGAARATEMASVYTSDAAERVSDLTRQLAAAVTGDGDGSELWLAFEQLGQMRPLDTVAARRRIAATLTEAGRYLW